MADTNDSADRPAPDLTNTTFAVLCGGEGRRMGGQDKPLLQWHAQPMVDHVLASVPDSMPKLISANRNLPEYAKRGRVITDQQADLQQTGTAGPLCGILAVLQCCETPWLLVAPGDAPALADNWWLSMMAAARRRNNHAVAHDGERQQHLHLLLHRSARTSLRGFLQISKYQVHLWLEQLQPDIAQFSEPAAFANMNLPGDLC